MPCKILCLILVSNLNFVLFMDVHASSFSVCYLHCIVATMVATRIDLLNFNGDKSYLSGAE